MPKKAKELSALQTKQLTKPGLHAVGGVAGLHLQVKDTGARSWILRVTVGAKRPDIGLGGYPDVTLAQARSKAREKREQIAQGIDPVLHRRESKTRLIEAQNSRIIFDEAVRRFLVNKIHEFKNAKHAAQWPSSLSTYASPFIGKLPVADITLHHIVRILEPIWLKKTETAVRLRGRIESVLAWATVHGYRSGDNPARWKGHLDAVLPKPSKVTNVVHHRALPASEVGAFMQKLSKRKGMAARALEFLILTATRSGEIRGATWDEIDLKKEVWTIPTNRMKGGKEHRVPLSGEAIALLKALPRLDDDEHVFPSSKGGVMSDMALNAVIRRMKVDAVPHGFRSTFRDWCGEYTNFPRDVAEMALAHTIKNKAEAAYRRGDMLAKRAKLMQAWAKYCGTVQKSGDVVPLHGTGK